MHTGLNVGCIRGLMWDAYGPKNASCLRRDPIAAPYHPVQEHHYTTDVTPPLPLYISPHTPALLQGYCLHEEEATPPQTHKPCTLCHTHRRDTADMKKKIKSLEDEKERLNDKVTKAKTQVGWGSRGISPWWGQGWSVVSLVGWPL